MPEEGTATRNRSWNNESVTRHLRDVFREPFSERAIRELLWGIMSVLTAVAGAYALVLTLVVGLVATGAARTIGRWYRSLASTTLALRIGEPAPLEPDRARRRLEDPVSWRASAYVLLKTPFACLYAYAAILWLGAVNLTYPFWWGLFRNHQPGVTLSPVPVFTPFGIFHISSLAGTLVAFCSGAAMVLAAPWVTRAFVTADRKLMTTLLGPQSKSERLRQLEASRSHVVEDSAATLRRVERDLHDGAQAQLATLAMKLGQAKEKLERPGETNGDRDGALHLVDAAHRHAKDALVELRNVARGIHPPALDLGLEPAVTTLVARSAIPTTLCFEMSSRPSQAAESITYFVIAELLANVARHSGATQASVAITGTSDRLRIVVTDDGRGGAAVGMGSGLTGLAGRVAAVDGNLNVASPRNGPTVVTVDLPREA
jgi:signal transduction histidine kinase